MAFSLFCFLDPVSIISIFSYFSAFTVFRSFGLGKNYMNFMTFAAQKFSYFINTCFSLHFWFAKFKSEVDPTVLNFTLPSNKVVGP